MSTASSGSPRARAARARAPRRGASRRRARALRAPPRRPRWGRTAGTSPGGTDVRGCTGTPRVWFPSRFRRRATPRTRTWNPSSPRRSASRRSGGVHTALGLAEHDARAARVAVDGHVARQRIGFRILYPRLYASRSYPYFLCPRKTTLSKSPARRRRRGGRRRCTRRGQLDRRHEREPRPRARVFEGLDRPVRRPTPPSATRRLSVNRPNARNRRAASLLTSSAYT